MDFELGQLIHDIASAIKEIDSRRPQAANARTGAPYQPGIGPHSETQAVSLILAQLLQLPLREIKRGFTQASRILGVPDRNAMSASEMRRWSHHFPVCRKVHFERDCQIFTAKLDAELPELRQEVEPGADSTLLRKTTVAQF